MIAAAGVGAALGGVLLVWLLRVAPPRPAPVVELARFDARGATAAVAAETMNVAAGGVGSLRSRVGGWLLPRLARRGVGLRSLRQDIALCGGDVASVLGRKVLLAGAGVVLGGLAAAAVAAAWGIDVPAAAVVVTAAGFGAVLFVLPDVDARRVAAARRAEFRRALGAYLDLVALEMAGSAAPAEALPSAARVGVGWPFALIRDTLYRATRAGRSPWAALAELGGRIGVAELRDLGQLVALVAHDGARVRSTLTARAQTMRRAELADLEGRAGKADQSMRIAQILIAVGFLVFLAYPAVVAVLSF